MNFNKQKIALAIGLLFPIMNACADDVQNCTVNASGAITSVEACYSQPDEYYMTIFQIGLCTSDPTSGGTLPTTSSGPNLSSCKTVYTAAGTNGDSVQVLKGATTPLVGTISKPSNGQYSYGYVVIAPQFRVKTSKSFANAVTAYNSGGSGTTCWTKDSVQYVYQSDTVGMPANCGSSAASVGTTVQYMNSFSPYWGSNNQILTPTYSTTAAGGVSAFLTTSDLKLGSGSGDAQSGTVTRLLGVQTLSATVSDSTNNLNLGFNVSQGTTVIMNQQTNPTRTILEYFGGGPFSVQLTLN